MNFASDLVMFAGYAAAVMLGLRGSRSAHGPAVCRMSLWALSWSAASRPMVGQPLVR